MAKVKLKRRWFIEGHRFMAGVVEEIPDRFLDRLPSGAEIIEGDAPARAATDPASSDDDFKAKLFPACPKVFWNDDETQEVQREEAVAKALASFEAEGNDRDGWNELENIDRRGRIQAAARSLLGEPENDA